LFTSFKWPSHRTVIHENIGSISCARNRAGFSKLVTESKAKVSSSLQRHELFLSCLAHWEIKNFFNVRPLFKICKMFVSVELPILTALYLFRYTPVHRSAKSVCACNLSYTVSSSNFVFRNHVNRRISTALHEIFNVYKINWSRFVQYVIIIIIIIIIIIVVILTYYWFSLPLFRLMKAELYYYYYYYYVLLSQVFFLPWYFSSWASSEPHHSGFKSKLVALSSWCVMLLVWQFFVGNLLSVVLVLFPDTFVKFTYSSGGPNDYWYDKVFHVPHSLNFHT
jgi:hypothetical protein